MLAVAEKVKTCTRCLLDKPISEFRLRKKCGEKRHAECNGCHRRNINARNARLRSRDVKKYVAKLALETEWERIVTLCQAAFRRCRGFENFFRTMWEGMQRQPPGSTLILRGHIAIMNMYVAAEQQRGNPSLHCATNSDIVDAFEHSLQKMIREQPEIVLLAAAKLGWQVQEPETWEASSPRRGAVATDQ